jgi:hypothetical protein
LIKRLAPAALVAVSAMVLSLSVSAPATASDRSVVVDSASAEHWTGKVQATTPHIKHVPECQNTGCDSVSLRVDLPRRLEGAPGGVHVKLQLLGATPDDSVGLVIYNKKQVVAHSSAQIGPARSVLLPSVDARYTVYVYYNPMARELGSPRLKYEAYARYEAKPTYPGPTSELLPDLQALPQRYVTFESPVTFFDDTVSSEYPSCFRSEAEEEPFAKLCFRFGQAMANIGKGPMDVRYSTPPGDKPHQVAGYQRVYRTDGTFYDLPSVGTMHYHEIHSHYHFEDFAVSELWTVDANGNLAQKVASGSKNGFCAADTELFWWNASGPRADVQSFPAPRCLEPQTVDPDGTSHFKHGISPGWADEYWWALPDQMIDVYGLPDGTYALVTKVDPAGKIKETDDSNNCNRITVTLSGLATSAPAAAALADSARPC